MAARTLVARCDDLCLTGETLLDLAVVLEAAGMTERARAEGAEALRMFEAKGAALPAGRVREWLAAHEPGTAGGAADGGAADGGPGTGVGAAGPAGAAGPGEEAGADD